MAMGKTISEQLQQGGTLLLDGGLATELESAGHDISGQLWSAALLRDNPQAIVDAHLAYLKAGADCIISASYQASREGFMSTGLSAYEADQLIASSVTLACEARDAQRGRKALVAASIGPYGAVLHDGSEYRGNYRLSEERLFEFHRRRIQLLDECGPDLLACETIPDRTEAAALHRLLGYMSTPAWVSFQCRDGRHIADGTPLRDMAAMFADHPRVMAIGINCTAPQHVPALIAECRAGAPDKIIIAYPNSGERFEAADNSWHGTATADEFATAALRWQALGARILGGCCRVGPTHIAAMRKALSQPARHIPEELDT
jgi:homocysteine S-methyltransferase